MSFDADQFLNAAVEGSNSTKIQPCPIGEYPGLCEKVEARQWQSKDGTKTGVALDVFWSVQDPQVQQALGRESVTVKQGIMLDLTSSGGLDMSEGRNVGLGRLRAAVDLNEGQFAFNMLPGRMAKLKVSHRQDQKDPEIVYAQVDAVAHL